jgi:DNA-directed RNA polymerase specialized sigma24 family protein
MNSIQRRLFRTFVQAGGDLTEDVEVERFVRYVEATLATLPPKVRSAIEMTWQAPDRPSYASLAARLSASEGVDVSPTALRQRVSRGLRQLEEAIRRRDWGLPTTARRG